MKHTLTIICLFAAAFICSKPTCAQENVITVRPETGTIRKLLRFTGETQPALEAFATADVAGPVAQIMVENGQKVTANQALAKIDAIRFEIALRQSEAALTRARQQLEEDERDFERNKTLYGRKAITQKTFDMATTNVIKSRTTVKQAEADREEAKLDLDRCIIRAPIAGYFVDRSIEIGQAMNRGQTMGRIMHLDELYVEARIPESSIRAIRVDQDCLIENKFDGKIEHINLYADSSRSFRIKIRISNPDLYFRGNMFVRGQIIIESYEDVLMFPSAAIRTSLGQSYVFLVKNNCAERRDITVTAQEGSMTHAPEIKPDEEIVTVGQDNLENGMEVIVRTNNNGN